MLLAISTVEGRTQGMEYSDRAFTKTAELDSKTSQLRRIAYFRAKNRKRFETMLIGPYEQKGLSVVEVANLLLIKYGFDKIMILEMILVFPCFMTIFCVMLVGLNVTTSVANYLQNKYCEGLLAHGG